jgi:DKNYY family protein
MVCTVSNFNQRIMRKLIFILLLITSPTLFFAQAIKTDTIVYKLLRCGLYKGSNGDIAYRSQEIYNDTFDKRTRYITWIYGVDQKDSLNGGLKKMKYVVDTNSFRFLSTVYWADKRNVYYFTPTSDGGTVSLCDQIDSKSIVVLGNTRYAKDKANVYYQGAVVEGADRQSFIIIDQMNPDLARDKFNFYQAGNVMRKEEVEALQLHR